MTRAGRRPGNSESRERILVAARKVFGQRGYDAATVRAIATEAGVNPAMVHYFFGSKDRVFVAALNLPVDPTTLLTRILEGPRDEVGQRIVRILLELWHPPESREPFLALLRSVVTNEEAVHLVSQFMQRTVFEQVAQELGVSQLRLSMLVAQIFGIALMRYVVGLMPVASAEDEEIVELVAPVIQYYVDAPAHPKGSA